MKFHSWASLDATQCYRPMLSLRSINIGNIGFDHRYLRVVNCSRHISLQKIDFITRSLGKRQKQAGGLTRQVRKAGTQGQKMYLLEMSIFLRWPLTELRFTTKQVVHAINHSIEWDVYAFDTTYKTAHEFASRTTPPTKLTAKTPNATAPPPHTHIQQCLNFNRLNSLAQHKYTGSICAHCPGCLPWFRNW